MKFIFTIFILTVLLGGGWYFGNLDTETDDLGATTGITREWVFDNSKKLVRSLSNAQGTLVTRTGETATTSAVAFEVIGDSLFDAASSTNFAVTGLTAGNCVQAGTGGALTSASAACGTGGGGGGAAWEQIFSSPVALTPTTTGAGIFVTGSSTVDNTLRINQFTVTTTTASSTIAHSLVVDTSTLVVNANEGRVGIGTATPSQLLQVAGTALIDTLNLTNALTVANGGTGATTLTDGGVLVGSGTGAITALAAGTNGQLLIGSTGADPVFATLTCDANLTCTTGAGTLEIDLDTTLTGLANITATGAIIFSDGSLEIPNGTAPTVNAIGEIAFDTTDNQFLVATSTEAAWPAVFPSVQRLWSATIASTSVEFRSGGSIPMYAHRDAVRVKEIHCHVEGGTSVVINLSNTGGTLDTETVICDTNGASDTDISTNNAIGALASTTLEIGTVTGSPDYLIFSIWGSIVRE